jgi:hypothetical protein
VDLLFSSAFAAPTREDPATKSCGSPKKADRVWDTVPFIRGEGIKAPIKGTILGTNLLLLLDWRCGYLITAAPCPLFSHPTVAEVI